jgi:hypothetical protein
MKKGMLLVGFSCLAVIGLGLGSVAAMADEQGGSDTHVVTGASVVVKDGSLKLNIFDREKSGAAEATSPAPNDQANVNQPQSAPGPDIEISGVEVKKTITCHGEKVVVEGNENHVRVKGECRVIKVSGNGNVCRVDAVEKIVIDGGNNNEVEWKQALGGDEPKTKDDGNNSNIHKIGQVVNAGE